MSTESHIYYGFSLTEDYTEVQEAMADVSGKSDFDLGSYVSEQNIGQSHYDGGGYGQVTFIGREIEMTERGFVVTDKIIEEVKAMIATLDPDLTKALTKVFGEVPQPRFDYEHSDG